MIDNPCQIESIDNNGNYVVQYCDTEETHILSRNFCDSHFRLWTIQDAKDGDVLQLGRVTAIFQKYIGNGNCKCYCSVCSGEFEIPSQDGADNSYGCHNAIPSTKEQRDLLFQKMKEAGYEWDAEKKELRKVEQTSAWSKEDEKILNLIIARLHSHPNVEAEEYGKDYHWLKSLKDKYAWKPSDEQMAVLNEVINYAANSELQHWSNFIYTLLKSLREQLKKLREE